jgi:hypothetical protein
MGLAALLRDPDTLEFDLQRYHGIDVADYWRGELSLRRLSVLVYHLPPESATARKFNPDVAGWTVEAYLLAHLYQTLTGEPHPALPKEQRASNGKSRYRELRAALEAQRARREAELNSA